MADYQAKCYLYEIFHENSKLNEITTNEMGERIGSFYINPFLTQAVHEAYKVYPYKEKYKLKRPDLQVNFFDIIKKRRSLRNFSKYNLTLDELSSLFYYSYGIVDKIQFTLEGIEHVQAVRTAPSAGGCYPLELYLVLLCSEELPTGIYHYNVVEHCLELIEAGDYRKQIIEYMPQQQSLDTASGVMVITAIFGKNTIKYGERGYRFIHLDAGHLMQNIYLTLTALGLGCYACGGFFDDEFDNMLELDGRQETTIYSAPFGKDSR
jgi:SagB-type dehydrogenase family enzyme